MSESILEKALLEAEQLEETMKSNAKEILSSTMKEEIHELVKESLNENDYLKEQEEEVDVLDIDDEIEGEELDMDLPIPDDIELGIEDETEDDEVTMELPPLDLTLASDAEVLKVFKAMGDEDGIIIQQDDDEIELTDTTTDTEYIIKLEESKKTKTMKKSRKVNEDMEDMDNIEMDEMDEFEVDEDEEVVYEIELSEDEMEDDTETTEVDEHQSFTSRRHEREGMDKYLGNKPDNLNPLSNSKQGYDARMDDSLGALHGHLGEDDDVEGEMKERAKYGGNKGDHPLSKGDFEMKERAKYGGNKGDHPLSKGDFEMKEMVRQNNLGQKVHAGNRTNKYNKTSRKHSGINLGESRIRKSYNLLKEEVDTLKVKNSDYRKALTTFRDKLNEVGVFNSNLAYVTRLFTEHSTTKPEKINILKRFDNIDSLKSSKGLYKVIKEELSQEVAKSAKTISEAVEQKITKSPTSSGGGKLLESKVYENPQFSRMKDLMSKLK